MVSLHVNLDVLGSELYASLMTHSWFHMSLSSLCIGLQCCFMNWSSVPVEHWCACTELWIGQSDYVLVPQMYLRGLSCGKAVGVTFWGQQRLECASTQVEPTIPSTPTLDEKMSEMTRGAALSCWSL